MLDFSILAQESWPSWPLRVNTYIKARASLCGASRDHVIHAAWIAVKVVAK